MSFSLTWLPAVLESAGLKVAPVPGWESRGRAEMGRVLGVMCHHTAGPRQGNMPSLRTLIEGRRDLPGPLSQLGLGRDGTYYIVAAGRCNHAGAGSWQGLTGGNTNFIGIEAENTGLPDNRPWPEVQLDAYRRGVAAILRHAGRTALFCAGHKEYALPSGRKNDPDFDMDAFRRAVAAIIDDTAPPPSLIPKAEPQPSAGQPAARATLRRGSVDELVKVVQKKCGLPDDGVFGANTEAAVRRFQNSRGMVPDGIVGPKTWAALDTA
ncbi:MULTISPECIES: N-acetylmuramoyl-L-alanine amidase [unclassified Variovorax]|uniref:peptidoglycan recognition protein family protein n=1 Tax=unclassified Variovorax TaxID=663243 RepID=UPI0008CD2E69|nr:MULTISPECIES: N-acetylmuramoyl-L-alanine amidase [unclassified Variovorax]SEJ43689.1 N-acetylmuramoyl-L-alanine amidase [Variovorax sp. OK202]SFC41804.1 N-acetylmuramoyl-L-alanine amidase [Variovorax sp. OK212]